MIRTTNVEFQTSTTIIPQGNLTSDHEIKQYIWQWNDKEDCSRSEVPYVILINWTTVATTQNEAQSLKCHYFLTSHSTPMCLSYLGKVFTIVMAEIQWLRCCATNRKVTVSIPDSVIGIFHWHNPPNRTVALGSTQPLTEMSTRRISWG